MMYSIVDPSAVRFGGPLVGYRDAIWEELMRRGYASTSAANTLRLAAHLSRWLESQRLGTRDLTQPVLDRFLTHRRATYTRYYTVAALAPILDVMRARGVAPADHAETPSTAAGRLLRRYRDYLIEERGLTLQVGDAYCHWVTPFVDSRTDGAADVRLESLTAGDITGFLNTHMPSLSVKSAQMTACALRSFLRFSLVNGLVSTDLTGAVPAVAARGRRGLVEPLTSAQIEVLLTSCDRDDRVGCRDYAVLLVLTRLGLRSAEAAELRLSDVDWQAGTLTVRGKGHRTDVLPIPGDVGQALVDYLHDGRPETTSRHVFVCVCAPLTGLGRSAISGIVARAAQRAGLGTIHARRLRHTVASRTLNAGADLPEVAQLLRHSSLATTAGYAQTDPARLATIMRPWPTAGGQS